MSACQTRGQARRSTRGLVEYGRLSCPLPSSLRSDGRRRRLGWLQAHCRPVAPALTVPTHAQLRVLCWP